jgi:Protein of unknown function (DUF2865)
VFSQSHMSLGRPVSGLALVVLTALVVALPAAPASAQGVFNFLFGGPRQASPGPSTAYADPNASLNNPFGNRPDQQPYATPSPSASYCVRLCDGRFFPIQRSSGADPVETCNNFCPAARTKVYSGSGIEHATARDGTSYAKLDTAFVYRDRTVPGCTCNGRDAFGLVIPSAADDPTLRAGDIVASDKGFVAYAGGHRQNAEFTPIESYGGLSSEFRQKLAAAKIAPRNATPVSAQALADAAKAAARVSARDRRVQASR